MSDLLWHYTCAHTRERLGERGTLFPPLWQISNVPGGLPVAAYALLGVVWATDADDPPHAALGLTSATLSCDRMAHRYSVPREAFTRWGRFRSRFPAELVEPLETALGAEPALWWIAEGPVEGARLDLTYRR